MTRIPSFSNRSSCCLVSPPDMFLPQSQCLHLSRIVTSFSWICESSYTGFTLKIFHSIRCKIYIKTLSEFSPEFNFVKKDFNFICTEWWLSSVAREGRGVFSMRCLYKQSDQDLWCRPTWDITLLCPHIISHTHRDCCTSEFSRNWVLIWWTLLWLHFYLLGSRLTLTSKYDAQPPSYPPSSMTELNRE